MPQAFSLQQILCRPVLERDLDDIKEFCKTIWDGHDYVPEVIDDWLLDPQGIFAVAEYQGRAIACSKITWLGGGQWWLEGFRVDPNYQGLKVGSMMHHYVDQWWLEHGDGILRLMTSSKNKSVHHLCESTGYTKLFDVRGYKADPLPGQVDMFTPAASSEKDLPPLVEFARASPSLALTNCIVDFGWRLAEPTRDNTLKFLFAPPSARDRHFFWWHEKRGLLIVWDDSEEEKRIMGIGVLGCQLDDMPALLKDARLLAATRRCTSVFWLAPLHERVQSALEETGYSSDWDNTAYVFEKKHPTRE